jgi:hypothetical protein
MTTKITVTYRAVDGFRRRRVFKTLAGARRFAQRYVGEHPDVGTSYAVSPDGVGTVYVAGATLGDLFPPSVAQCPHGRTAGECNACDVAGDFAFDAAREDRFFQPLVSASTTARQ